MFITNQVKHTESQSLASAAQTAKNVDSIVNQLIQNKENLQNQKGEEVLAWLNSANEAFLTILDLTPAATPMDKGYAMHLSRVLTHCGITGYGKFFLKKAEEKDPISQKDRYEVAFEKPLTLLKAALLMEAYALDLTDHHPDFSMAHQFRDLCGGVLKGQIEAGFAQLKLDSAIWAQKASKLNQEQTIELSKALRFTNGAIRYLTDKPDEAKIDLCGQILGVAEALLAQARNNTSFDLVEINNEMAELIYNDLTGLAIWKGQKELLPILTADAITLSKDPDRMRALCKNKFAYDGANPLENLLEAERLYKTLPEERRHSDLILLNLSNIGFSYLEKGNLTEALKYLFKAKNLVDARRNAGQDNIQFQCVEKNLERVIAGLSVNLASAMLGDIRL